MTATIDVPVDRPPCGRPFRVAVPVYTESHDGWLAAVVDTDHLALAVRAHVRQHA